MVNRKNDMKIRNGQKPELLRFEPLGFFKGTTFGTVAVLTRFVAELPALAFRASLQNAAHGGSAAIHNRAHRLKLLIRKTMSTFVFADVLSENIGDFKTRSLRIYTVRIWRELYFGSSSFTSMVLTTD